MSTRGALGVRINGVDKIAYNHHDSYPDGLGYDVIDAVANMKVDMPKAKRMAAALQALPVDGKGNTLPPTEEHIKLCEPFTDLGVSGQSTKDWYCLTRRAQGDLFAMLQMGLYENSAEFMGDSLFCEWAYIVNFDDEVIEVYEGFQRAPHTKGRFAGLDVKVEEQKAQRSRYEKGEPDVYYPVALVGTIPFSVVGLDLKTVDNPARVALDEMVKKPDEDEVAA